MLTPRIPVQRFLSAGEFFLGKGAIHALHAVRSARCLVVINRSTYTNASVFASIQKALKADLVDVWVCVSDEEPTQASIQPIVARLATLQPDTLIAIGGGTCLDSAKLAWYFYEHGDQRIDAMQSPRHLGSMTRLKFYAAPTTCGSGSEVSSAAVISVGEMKVPIVTHEFLPAAVFLDPDLVLSLPRRLRLEGAIDALAHAIEGWLSPIENRLMDLFAIETVAVIAGSLSRALTDSGDLGALHDLQLAAVLGGVVQNHCLTGVCHAIAHRLGRYRLPHARLIRLFLPAVMQFYLKHDKSAASLHRLFDRTSFGSPADFLQHLSAHCARLNEPLSVLLPRNRLELETDLSAILTDRLTTFSPIAIDRDAVHQIVDIAYDLG